MRLRWETSPERRLGRECDLIGVVCVRKRTNSGRVGRVGSEVWRRTLSGKVRGLYLVQREEVQEHCEIGEGNLSSVMKEIS